MSIPKLSYLNPQVCKVEILPTIDVNSIVVSDDGNSAAVNLKSSKVWFPIYVTPGKTSYDEEQLEDQGNTYFNQKLEFQYPGEDANSIAYLKDFNNSRSVIKFTYSSGLVKLIGTVLNPCTMQIHFSAEKGVRLVTLSRKSTTPAINYTP